MLEVQVESLSQFVDAIGKNTQHWTNDGFVRPWFRGQTDKAYKLLPSIFRDHHEKEEFALTTKFRLLAPGFTDTPDTGRIDQWLFLAQHHGVPTRLLDWSESALIALYFATQKCLSRKIEPKSDIAIYAIDPMKLNRISKIEGFPNTWVQNNVLQTIKFAFGTEIEEAYDKYGKRTEFLEYPVAIYPSTIHSRIKTQKGCFTLHGNDKRSFEEIFDNTELVKQKYLFRIIIRKEVASSVFEELNGMGITQSSIFEDLDGLAKDLKYQFHIG